MDVMTSTDSGVKKERFTKKGTKKNYKTDTIAKRAIYVYLPSIEEGEKWKNLAEKSGLSISKFVVEHVENSLRQEEDEDIYGSRTRLMKEIRGLKDENIELRKRNEMLERVIEKLDEENKRYRMEPFLNNDFKGIRKYEEGLIKLFKSRTTIKKEDIFELLGINPMKNGDIAKGITKQLENLEHYGLIEDKGKLWKWKPPE